MNKLSENTTTYYEWIYEDVPGAASMGSLKVEFSILDAINRGRPVASFFPKDAYFQMDPLRLKNVMLIDNVYNAESFALVSSTVRTFLEKQGIQQLELLPVGVLDHRARRIACEYFIVHPCRVVDCIDQNRSKFEWNQLDFNAMSPIETIVLNPSKLGQDDILIRPRYVEHMILVRQDLAMIMMSQNFKGLYMADLNE